MTAQNGGEEDNLARLYQDSGDRAPWCRSCQCIKLQSLTIVPNNDPFDVVVFGRCVEVLQGTSVIDRGKAGMRRKLETEVLHSSHIYKCQTYLEESRT